jgi:hypothetical protein
VGERIVLPGRECDWTGCPQEATSKLDDVVVKPKGAVHEVVVGRVKLCDWHFKMAARDGRLVLDWDRILGAKAAGL